MLYLFDDPTLGGTSFYAPTQDAAVTDRLVHDSCTLDNESFTARHGIKPGYMSGSNAYFREIGRVEARWNRMLFYDGFIFHSGNISTPQALVDDPMSGRLTLNGFFTCSALAS